MPSAATSSHTFAWQGWSLAVPAEWNPVKLEGDWNKGSVLLADLEKTRLALRWGVASGRKFDPDKEIASILKRETGDPDAGDDLRPSDAFSAGRLFEDDELPGRDLFVAYSSRSRRRLEISLPQERRNGLLRRQLLPTLDDQPNGEPLLWSLFGLTCRSPAGYRLLDYRLHAGDLTLRFGLKRSARVIRQIQPAKLALARQTAQRWLEAHQNVWRQHYAVRRGKIETSDGLLERVVKRRRRFGFAWWIARQRVTLLRHDEAGNRLILSDAETADAARQLLDDCREAD